MYVCMYVYIYIYVYIRPIKQDPIYYRRRLGQTLPARKCKCPKGTVLTGGKRCRSSKPGPQGTG